MSLGVQERCQTVVCVIKGVDRGCKHLAARGVAHLSSWQPCRLISAGEDLTCRWIVSGGKGTDDGIRIHPEVQVGPDLVDLAEAAELIALSRHRYSIFLGLPTSSSAATAVEAPVVRAGPRGH